VQIHPRHRGGRRGCGDGIERLTARPGPSGLEIFLRRRSPGVLKGTLRVSLRDRCATPDMPVRSQDRAAIGVREENGAGAAGSGRATAQVHRGCKTVQFKR